MTNGMNVTFNEGIATLELKLEKVNKIGEAFGLALTSGLDQALAHDGLKGIIITSGHKDFCVGADIDKLFTERDPARMMAACNGLNALYRRIETCGVPVVAALTGSALGGGYELALACHHRIALNSGRIQVGLPEVNLGVIPGAGGTQRLPYIMGLQASMEHMAGAQPVRAPKALQTKMVEQLAETPEELLAKATAWILENKGYKQPWDQKKYSWPGGVRPGTPGAMQLFVGASAFLYKKTAGVFPAAEAVIRAVADGTRLTFERGLEVETRLFAELAVSDQCKDMIRSLWYHRLVAEKRGSGLEHGFKKVSILGAGMMGAGLGFLSAKTGCEVVIKDIGQAQLDAGQAHVEAQLKRLKHLGADAVQEIRDRITYTLDNGPIAGSDLVIEAVIENVDIKHSVIREVEPLLADNAVFASNTSAIPIGLLAQASIAKDRFVGMHFFSPVEKMPLLEIIQPEGCSDATVNRTLAFGKALKKTSIVVNDGYGFYTSRLFASYLMEGVQLVAEGHDPVLVEYAARTAGMVMPPLKVFDEVSLTLGMHGFEMRQKITGENLDGPALDLVGALVDAGRHGKKTGAGFYEWKKPRVMWSGLKDLVKAETPEVTGLPYLQRRLMVRQAAEVGRILDEGLIRENLDVEVGAIFGLGFAPNTGGPLAWMDRQGLRPLVMEMRDLATQCGERFAPAPLLVNMAEKGETFWPKV